MGWILYNTHFEKSIKIKKLMYLFKVVKSRRFLSLDSETKKKLIHKIKIYKTTQN